MAGCEYQWISNYVNNHSSFLKHWTLRGGGVGRDFEGFRALGWKGRQAQESRAAACKGSRQGSGGRGLRLQHDSWEVGQECVKGGQYVLRHAVETCKREEEANSALNHRIRGACTPAARRWGQPTRRVGALPCLVPRLQQTQPLPKCIISRACQHVARSVQPRAAPGRRVLVRAMEEGEGRQVCAWCPTPGQHAPRQR